MPSLLATLREQRWDDHRYYHQSTVNQALHLISAISFLVAYGVLLFDPPLAALIAWGISMVTRQSGHFFFEPKGFDTINGVSHEYKEAVKVGYNLRRKMVLMGIWALIPLGLMWEPEAFGLLTPHTDAWGLWRNVGWLWLWLGVASVLLRVGQLLHTHGAVPALAWVTKILTDPLHDIWLYWRAPLLLLRGQRLAPAHPRS